MREGLVSAVLNEGGWFVSSLGLALAAVTGLILRLRGSPLSRDQVAVAALSAGTTVGCMAFGHLLAVTTKLALGTLVGSALPLAVPSLLTLAYAATPLRAARLAIVGLAVAVNIGLFAGALVFLASGQTFEQFSGID